MWEIMFEKVIVITLLFVTWNGNIKQESFEIFESCDSWFHHNVKQKEKKKKTFMTNHYYYEFKGKKVIGYICSDKVPQ